MNASITDPEIQTDEQHVNEQKSDERNKFRAGRRRHTKSGKKKREKVQHLNNVQVRQFEFERHSSYSPNERPRS